MLFAEDAAKRIAAIAADLRKAQAADHLADSLEQAADAIRVRSSGDGQDGLLEGAGVARARSVP